MAMEHGAKAAANVAEGLKNSPLALALIVINVLFLAGGIWFLHEVTNAIQQDRDNRNAIVRTLLQTCGYLSMKEKQQ
jgi:hypothetical protein